MKTTKKILAAFIAVMMIVMMIPVASAATQNAVPEGPYTVKYKISVDDDAKLGNYTYSLYKIASLDTKTAKYTSTVDGVQGLLSEVTPNTQSIIDVATEAYKKGELGEAKADFSVNVAEKNKTYEASATVDKTEPGIYLVVATSKPATVTAVANSLAVLPVTGATGTEWSTTSDQTTANLGSKINASGVSVYKVMDKPATDKNLALGDKVDYTLTATITGSLENKLTKYAIVDTIDAGLTINVNSFVVTLKKDGITDDTTDDTTLTLTKDTDYTVVPDYEYKVASADKKCTYAVVIDDSMLNSETFYKYSSVEVKLNATLNENAKTNTALPNKDGLVYGNSDGTFYEDGPTVESITYAAKVLKNNEKGQALANAEFTVYTDAAATTTLKYKGEDVKAVTGDNGYGIFKAGSVEFKFDADKTYYVKETKAPDGYNLNSTIFELKVGSSKDTAGYTVLNDGAAVINYSVVVPQTGGMGTFVFTIVGASLIACAGVLFLVIRRKKSSK